MSDSRVSCDAMREPANRTAHDSPVQRKPCAKLLESEYSLANVYGSRHLACGHSSANGVREAATEVVRTRQPRLTTHPLVT